MNFLEQKALADAQSLEDLIRFSQEGHPILMPFVIQSSVGEKLDSAKRYEALEAQSQGAADPQTTVVENQIEAAKNLLAQQGGITGVDPRRDEEVSQEDAARLQTGIASGPPMGAEQQVPDIAAAGGGLIPGYQRGRIVGGPDPDIVGYRPDRMFADEIDGEDMLGLWNALRAQETARKEARDRRTDEYFEERYGESPEIAYGKFPDWIGPGGVRAAAARAKDIPGALGRGRERIVSAARSARDRLRGTPPGQRRDASGRFVGPPEPFEEGIAGVFGRLTGRGGTGRGAPEVVEEAARVRPRRQRILEEVSDRLSGRFGAGSRGATEAAEEAARVRPRTHRRRRILEEVGSEAGVPPRTTAQRGRPTPWRDAGGEPLDMDIPSWLGRSGPPIPSPSGGIPSILARRSADKRGSLWPMAVPIAAGGVGAGWSLRDRGGPYRTPEREIVDYQDFQTAQSGRQAAIDRARQEAIQAGHLPGSREYDDAVRRGDPLWEPPTTAGITGPNELTKRYGPEFDEFQEIVGEAMESPEAYHYYHKILGLNLEDFEEFREGALKGRITPNRARRFKFPRFGSEEADEAIEIMGSGPILTPEQHADINEIMDAYNRAERAAEPGADEYGPSSIYDRYDQIDALLEGVRERATERTPEVIDYEGARQSQAWDAKMRAEDLYEKREEFRDESFETQQSVSAAIEEELARIEGEISTPEEVKQGLKAQVLIDASAFFLDSPGNLMSNIRTAQTNLKELGERERRERLDTLEEIGVRDIDRRQDLAFATDLHGERGIESLAAYQGAQGAYDALDVDFAREAMDRSQADLPFITAQVNATLSRIDTMADWQQHASELANNLDVMRWQMRNDSLEKVVNNAETITNTINRVRAAAANLEGEEAERALADADAMEADLFSATQRWTQIAGGRNSGIAGLPGAPRDGPDFGDYTDEQIAEALQDFSFGGQS